MNYYVFIPLTAFTINTFTWTYIFAQKRKSPVNRAYLTLAAILAIWAMESFLVWSISEVDWLFTLIKITAITGFTVPISYLTFTYVFLKKQKDYIYYFFVICAILSSIICALTNLHVSGYLKYEWGNALIGGVLYVPIISTVFALPLIYCIYIIRKAISKTIDKNTKNQYSFIFYGTSITFIIAFMSDVVFPFIFLINIPRIGISATAILSITVFWAVSKYNFLSISIEEAASYLFTNVNDGVILFDKNKNIIQANNTAIKMFDLYDFENNSYKFSALFSDYNFHENYKDHETAIFINGAEKIVSLSQAIVKNSNTEVGKILIIRDVTESKRAEKELKDSKTKLENLAKELAQANVSLEQKVAERTRSLRLSNEQLQREILERTRAEEELAAEKERLAVTLGSIGDGVITTDTAGNVVLLNRVAEQLTRWSQAEAIGQPLATVFQIVDDKTRSPCENPVEEALHTDNIVSRTHHSILVAKDQTERLIAENAAPIRDKDGKIIGVVLVFRDMTERRKIEEELMKADRLESIGVLAGGIAHDFNNILTAIIGNISLAKMYTNPSDKVHARLINAEKASLQAQNLTQQLLTFSKGGSLIRRPSSIVDIIKDCMDFSLRGSNVKCELSFNENVWPIEVDEGQISQVINNLIINANQAMPDGGTIEIHVENVDIREDDIKYLVSLQVGRYVKISVKDYGIGIPEENLSKIFDPYFTTKKKGSGLGLFSCYSIIKKHDGHITVESRQGAGATFHVYIPASHKHVPSENRQPDTHHVGRGYVLIMEDEETIREVTGEMLSHFGYEVAFARDGAEALALYQHAKDAGRPFDVLVMDLTIPGGMGGKETIKRLLELDPQARAIVASGYANDPIIAEFKQYGFCERIAKPYKSEELHRILHRVITGTDA